MSPSSAYSWIFWRINAGCYPIGQLADPFVPDPGEVCLGDGAMRRFGPCQVTLVEGLSGQDHTTRVTTTDPRITIAVPLADRTSGR